MDPLKIARNVDIISKYCDLTEIKEILNIIINDNFESLIIELRSKGYSDATIGRRLGYSTSYIALLRKQLKTRFMELWNQ